MLALNIAKTDEELEFLFKARTHPQVSIMLLGTPPSNLLEHMNYVNKVQGNSRYIMVAKDRGTLVGYSQIYDIKDNQCEIGFVIYPYYQGKGYGTEIVKETIKETRILFPDKKIVLYVKDTNVKGIYLYKKVGFVPISTSIDGIIYMEYLEKGLT